MRLKKKTQTRHERHTPYAAHRQRLKNDRGIQTAHATAAVLLSKTEKEISQTRPFKSDCDIVP